MTLAVKTTVDTDGAYEFPFKTRVFEIDDIYTASCELLSLVDIFEEALWKHDNEYMCDFIDDCIDELLSLEIDITKGTDPKTIYSGIRSANLVFTISIEEIRKSSNAGKIRFEM